MRVERLPSLSRLPTEVGREGRPCERCGATTEHIIYRVPRKMVFVYLRDHPQNIQATCVACARTTVLGGEDRERFVLREQRRS